MAAFIGRKNVPLFTVSVYICLSCFISELQKLTNKKPVDLSSTGVGFEW